MKFSKCNLIEGNLEIDLRIGIETAPAEKFTEAFGEIEEITGLSKFMFWSFVKTPSSFQLLDDKVFSCVHVFKYVQEIIAYSWWIFIQEQVNKIIISIVTDPISNWFINN